MHGFIADGTKLDPDSKRPKVEGAWQTLADDAVEPSAPAAAGVEANAEEHEWEDAGVNDRGDNGVDIVDDDDDDDNEWEEA